MEQGQCWMWTNKRKNSLSSSSLILPSPTNYYDEDSSWEEQAFAKDASGSAGCIWPPRSYSCSFCKREFRSAQALGGHMNVHRRDRARLKQPSSPSQNNEILTSHELETHHPQNQVLQTSFASMGYLYSKSSFSGLANYETNPNSDPNNSSDVLASPSNDKGQREKTGLIPLCGDSSIFQGLCHEKKSPVDASKSLKNLTEECRFHSSKKFNPDQALNLNLLVCRADHHPPLQFQETEISFKKRKTIDASSIIPFFTKPSSLDRNHVKSKVFEFSPSSIEELDLELRLGNRTKV